MSKLAEGKETAEMLIQENFQRKENQLKRGTTTSLIVVLEKYCWVLIQHMVAFCIKNFCQHGSSWFKILNKGIY